MYDYEVLENLFYILMILGFNFEFYFVDLCGELFIYFVKLG